MNRTQGLALRQHTAQDQEACPNGGGKVHLNADHRFQQHTGNGAQDKDDSHLFLGRCQLANRVLLLNVIRKLGIIDVGHETVTDKYHVGQ